MPVEKVSGVTWSALTKVSGVDKANIAKVSGVDAPSSYTGILDTVPNAGIGISVRKLLSSYSGSCMRVVRASDSTEQDIGFDGSGALDTAAIASFCSGTTGYVGIWYDQSGNGFDAAGKDYGVNNDSLPIIYASGAVTSLNGLPGVFFEHPRAFQWSDSGAQITDFIGTGPVNTDKAVTMHFVGQQGSAASQPWKLLFEDAVSAAYILQMYSDGSSERIDFGSTAASLVGEYTYDAQTNMISRVSGNTFEGFENGTSIGSNSNGSVQNPGSITGVDFRIGGGSFSSRNITGYIQELIVWKTAETVSTIYDDANTYFSIV
jgi:hypothetical protein